MNDDTRTSFEGYAILELMGHRRLGGYLREETIAGAAFIRIDVPEHPWVDGCTCGSDHPESADHEEHTPVCHMFREENDTALLDVAATQFYAPSAVYCITPTTEQMARLAAQTVLVELVQEWEARWLQPAPALTTGHGDTLDHEDDLPL